MLILPFSRGSGGREEPSSMTNRKSNGGKNERREKIGAREIEMK